MKTLDPTPTYTQAAVVAIVQGVVATTLDRVCNGDLTEQEAIAATNDALLIFSFGHVPNEWGVTLVPAAWQVARVPPSQQAVSLMAAVHEAPVLVQEVEGMRDPDSVYNRVKAALALADRHADRLRSGKLPLNASTMALTGREIASSINAALNLLAISVAVTPQEPGE